MGYPVRIIAAFGGVFLWTVQAQGELQPQAAPAEPRAAEPSGTPGNVASPPAAPAARVAAPAALLPKPSADELDVVDAHWMALTMWGEARAHGEAGMRAVGHVIHNRQRSGGGKGFVTDTVSKAYQFSCWNEGDPNREAMLNIHALRPGSADEISWRTAKRVAQEILSGRSHDVTGGAKFYHTTDVAPAWSRGLQPIQVIENHLFFRSAR